MQAFCCEVERALMKLGMAMAAATPTTAAAGTKRRAVGLWLPLENASQPSGPLTPTL